MVVDLSTNQLLSLRHESGLFSAAKPNGRTGYDKAWIRDNLYISLGLEFVNKSVVVKMIHALLDVLLKHEDKINYAIKEKPVHAYQYIHARYNPSTFEEFYEEWGNKQNDAVGLLLWRVGDLMSKGVKLLRGPDDQRIIQKLIDYLMTIEYWHDPDNGVWEEGEELHASSVGACVAGLNSVKRFFKVPTELINKGVKALNLLLPCESVSKSVDLALLSLIYPLNIVSRKQASLIIANVESGLLRNNGVIRYAGDQYYHRGGEAEWTMGLPWLAITHKLLGNFGKYKQYLNKSISTINSIGELPELYYADGDGHNDNSPLGWSQSLLITALMI